MPENEERLRQVSYCYQNWAVGTVFSLGHFHFNFDMIKPWEVEVEFYGRNKSSDRKAASVYVFGRDILLNLLPEEPENKDAYDVFAVDFPNSGVVVIYFKDVEPNSDRYSWCLFSFPKQMIQGFTDATLCITSKEEEQAIWDAQMEAGWAVLGQ